ncbi:MAG: Stage 0 sporulation protein A [Candidatus Dichloromethanomonas elyunquensis]|nr:MAG: Stage 0 sporulation protein A [Candidatus Dichloromethanomonas elyunquensis]
MLSGKIHVVVADDNKDFNDILCEYLNYQEGIEVIGTAGNGEDALDLILSKRPDIVVLDMIMPKLDGVSVLEKINSMPLERKPFFIMLSAIGNEKISQRALALGAEYYMTKPFDMNVLVNKIRQLPLLNYSVVAR